MGKGSAPRPFTDRAVFEDNFDKIFGKKKQSRIDTIGQNGNDGSHYEYELNKSTGEVEKRFINGTSKPNGEQFGNESDSTKS
jgi:hypothetical protein